MNWHRYAMPQDPLPGGQWLISFNALRNRVSGRRKAMYDSEFDIFS